MILVGDLYKERSKIEALFNVDILDGTVAQRSGLLG